MPAASSTRRALAGLAAAALSVTLAACGGAAEPTATPTPSVTASPAESATPTPSESPTTSATPTPVPVSDTIDGIVVSEALETKPVVRFEPPFAVDQTRWRVITPGSGPTVTGEAIIDAQYVGINARTGQQFDASWDRGAPAALSLQQVVPGFTKGLTDRRVGDRVLIAMPGPDGYDASGGNAAAGIEVGDTLIFVVDILAASVTAPTGEQVAPPAGLPTVGDEGGRPTLTIPAGAQPPAELVVQPLVRGTQRAVGENDFVMVHYRSWSWKTGQVLEDKYEQPDSGAIAETIPAWRKGIVGQPIGSRVLLVAPPAEGYPEGSNNPPVDKGDTVVYVVDILFASAG